MALTFAEVTTPTATGWNAFGHCWASGFGAAGMFLVCGTRTTGNDRILTTEDCVTFTYRTSPSASVWRAVAYSPTLDRAVIVGSGVAGFSDDGITWSAAGTLPEANNWCDVCWDARTARFVAVATTGTNRVMTSTDGTTWVAVAAAAAKQWIAVKASAGAVVAVAGEGASHNTQLVMRATDAAAATWALVTTPSAYLTLNDINNLGGSGIAYADTLNLLCLGVSTSTQPLMITSGDDGATWVEHTVPTPTDGRQCKGRIWIGEQFFVAKFSGAYYLTSPDGATWTKATQSSPPTNLDHDAWAWSPTLRKALSCERTPSAPFKALVVTVPAPPTPTRVTPAQGRTTGGRLVRITGTAFSGTPVVTFGGVAATSITVVSPTRITARTPAHAAGPVDVVVGSATLVDGFLYTDAMFGDLRIRRPQGILVDDTLNDAPNSATLRCERVGSPAAPALGAPVQLVDPASGGLLFGGTALVVTDGIDGRASNPGYRDLKAGDLAWRFNAVRPFGAWTERPADVVAQELIDTFAPAFTGVIAAGLPTISLVCNRSQTLSEVFSAIAALIGGAWYPDDAFGIHLFLTNPADPPDPITDVTPLYDPPPTVTRDLSQVRNRIFVKGAGPGDAFQEAVHPPTIDNMDVTPTTGGAIPNGTYEYSMTAVTAGGEGVPESLGYGGILDLLPSANTAFALADLDLTVSPDVRVVGRKLYRNRSVEDPTVPVTSLCVTRQYLITTLGNTAGIGEDTFLDGKADAELTQLAPNLDTTASIFVEVEDTAAQTYLAGLLNVDGGDDDGVRDGYVLDANLTTLAMATARAAAELALWAYPVETVIVAARDEKLVSGQQVAITLTNPAITGTFKIQHVQIDQVAIDATGMLFPRRTITASSVRYTLDDLLRDVLLTAGGTGGGGGSGSSSGSGGSGGGTPPVPTYVEDLTSQIGGTAFTIARVFTQIAVYKNGLRLRETDDYTVTGPSGFTMAIAPVAGDCVIVEYR